MAKPLRDISEKKIKGDEHLNHNKDLLDKRLEGSNDMKTLEGYNTKEPPSGMGPKEKGGIDFVKMHTIQKIADRNGNGDELFSASNISSHRDSVRHGYTPGEDEKVYDGGASLRKEEVEHLDEKAVSVSQQKLMAMALSYKRGEMEKASPAVKELAKSMTKKQLEDFAKTKHKGLPEKVSEGATTPIQTPTGVSASNLEKKRKVPPTEGVI